MIYDWVRIVVEYVEWESLVRVMERVLYELNLFNMGRLNIYIEIFFKIEFNFMFDFIYNVYIYKIVYII